MARTSVVLSMLAASSIALGSAAAWADGTETLGTPSISIASGTGIVAAGTGTITQPSTITVEVPDGAAIKQVLLYWEGFMDADVPGDSTAVVNGNPVSGTLIGGPTFFFGGAYASTFRADITGLGLVQDGSNSLTIEGLSFTTASNGAGVLVIFDDGSSNAEIAVRDGSDLAYFEFPPPLDGTVAQTFTFTASNADRTANIAMFFASVAGTTSGGTLRPTAIELTTNGPNGGTTVLHNVLDSIDGEEWDTFTIAFDIPAGATSLTVQPFSRDDSNTGLQPASFAWVGASFALEPETPPGIPGRMTGGGSVFTVGGVRVTRGFEIHCDLREPNNLEVNWGPGQKFHTTELTSAVCTDSPAVDQNPPNAPFDTFQGTGVGLLNNKETGTIEFVFVDAGEPGSSDTASIRIRDSAGNIVLDVPGDPNVPGFLDRGNVQAHKDTQSTL